MTCGISKNEAGKIGAELWEAVHPPPPLTFLIISLGQPQGNPLSCTPLVANGSGHPSELGSARRAGNGALGGPKAHRKLQTHPSLASQASRKSKGSTKSTASQIPLQAQEGKPPCLPGRGLPSWAPPSMMAGQAAAFSMGRWLEAQAHSHARPPGSEPLGGAQETGFNTASREPGQLHLLGKARHTCLLKTSPFPPMLSQSCCNKE